MTPLTNDELAELDKARNLAPKREVAIRAAEEIRHLRNKVEELQAEVTRLDDLYWDALARGGPDDDRPICPPIHP